MSLLPIFQNLRTHPFAGPRLTKAVLRFVRWQLAQRLWPHPSVVPFVNGAVLLARRGLTGATGQLYTGMWEFNDMGFLLHMLRPEDVFVDVGANLGMYTIPAAVAVGARVIAFEPVFEAREVLDLNLRLNRAEKRVNIRPEGCAEAPGLLWFTRNLDAQNRVALRPAASESEEYTRVQVVSLDDVLTEIPMLIKIDTEGYEVPVLAGSHRLLQTSDLKALIVETKGHGADYGFDEMAMHRQLLSLDFYPFSYNPFERRLSPLNQPADWNTIYCRDLPFVRQRLAEAPPFELWGEYI